MLKAACLLLTVILATGCEEQTQADEKAWLEGRWISNKALTLKSINSAGINVPHKLIESFGKMAYVFEEDRTTFTPSGTEKDQDQWYRWNIVRSEPSYVVIEISGLYQGPSIIEFSKNHGCLGLQPKGQAFTEFFCRE